MTNWLPLLLALFLTLLAGPALAVGQQEARLPPASDELRAEVRKGLEAARAGDDEEALEHLTRALDARDLRDLPQPVRARLHGARAGALLRLGRDDKALLDFHRAIRLDATDPEGWYGRGAIRAALGESEKALEDLAEAIRLNPRFGRAYRTRARLLADLSRFGEARLDLDQAVALDPDDAALHRERGLLRLVMADYAGAVDDFTEQARRDRRSLEPLLNRGRAQFYLGDFTAAAADFSAALERDPEAATAEVWLRLAEARAGLAAPDKTVTSAGDAWPAPVLDLLAGRIGEDRLLALAEEGGRAGGAARFAEAQYFLGQWDLIAGRPDQAERRFRLALQNERQDAAAHQGARAALGRLNAGQSRPDLRAYLKATPESAAGRSAPPSTSP